MTNFRDSKIMTKFRERPIISFIVFAIIAYILFKVINTYSLEFFLDFGFLTMESITSPGVIISLFIIALIYIYIYKIKGFFSFSKFKLAFLLACPMVLFAIANLFDPNFKISTLQAILIGVLAGLGPGFYEEVLFRGIIISYLMKFFKSSKGIYGVLIVSALLFGIVHLGNAQGAPLDATIFQVVYAAAVGILLGAVYLRTGNIWAPIFFHTLVDFTAFAFALADKVAAFSWNTVNIITLIASIVVVVLGFYYVRSSKHDEIIEVWEEKWAN